MTVSEIPASNLGVNTNKFHVVCDLNRLGARLFMTRLEYEHFSPFGEENDLLDVSMIDWPKDDFKIRWVIISVPIEYKEHVYKIATECSLRIADGVPTVLGGGKVETFPVNGPTVYTIEYTSDNPVYNQNQKEIDNLKNEEKKKCEEIIENSIDQEKAKMLSQGISKEEIDKIFSDDQKYCEEQADIIASKLEDM